MVYQLSSTKEDILNYPFDCPEYGETLINKYFGILESYREKSRIENIIL